MNPNSFESRLYTGYLRQYSDLLKSLYCKIAIAVLQNDRELMKEFILDAMHNGNKYPSILSRDALYYRAGKQFINKAYAITGAKPKNQFFKNRLNDLSDSKLEQLLNMRLECSEEDQIAFLRGVITLGPDFAASCKYIARANQLPESYEIELEKHSIVDYRTARKRALDANTIRNDYLGHDSDINILKLDINKCKKLIGMLYDAGTSFDDFNNSDVRKAKEMIEDGFNAYSKKLNNKPLKKSELEKGIEAFSIDTLKSLRFANEYDDESEKLFSYSLSEVKAEFERFYSDTAEASQALLDRITNTEKELEQRESELFDERKQNIDIKRFVDSFSNLIVDAAVPRIIEQMQVKPAAESIVNIEVSPEEEYTSTQIKTPVPYQSATHLEERSKSIKVILPEMVSYKGGPINPKQLEALAKNSVVIADADFWMNKENASFLARQFNHLMKKNNRKIVIDWSSRVELFKFERNIGVEATEDEIKRAKNAHTIMHMMVSKGYATYLPATDEVCSSDYSIIKIAKDNPDLIFTVFSNNSTFAERLAAEDLDNVIPISYIAASNLCIVRNNLKDRIIRTFSNTNNKDMTTGYKDENDENGSEELVLVKNDKSGSEFENILTNSNNDRKEENGYRNTNSKNDKSFDQYTIVEESKEVLPLDEVIGQGDTVQDKEGNEIQLGKELGKGGEGSVYECSEPGKAIKIYHRDKLTAMRLAKLELMIDNSPNSTKICWPEKIVFNKSRQFVGYTMKNASGYKEFGTTVLKLNSHTVAENSMKGWDRLALVELCIDLCKTCQKMHHKGILMGDVNPRNMMLNNSDPNNHTDYVLVDCDSYQIHGYPCPVGTTVFTSPKVYQRNNSDPNSLNFGSFLRTLEDENYAVASLLFHILMLNQSPFAKKNGAENIEEAIRNYDFAYRIKGDVENTGADVPDGAFRMIWNNMPNSVKELFGAVFKRAEDVSLERWIDALNSYRNQIKQGKYTRELTPKLYLDISGDFTVSFRCDACGEERNMPKERFQRIPDYMPRLCNDCRSISNMMREESIRKNCIRCGNTYDTDRWEEWLIEKGYKKSYCASCRSFLKERRRNG